MSETFNDTPGSPINLHKKTSTPGINSGFRRIGLQKEKQVHVEMQTDDINGTGGERIGSITVFGEANNNQTENKLFNEHFRNNRSGRTIKNTSDFVHLDKITPILRLNVTDVILEGDENINHEFGQYSYGQGESESLHKITRNGSLISFIDYGGLNPVDYIDNNNSIGYPFLIRINQENYNDISDPKTCGSIDIFGIRKSISGLGSYEQNIKGVKADYQAGQDVSRNISSTIIEDIFEIHNNETGDSLFHDSNESILGINVPGFISSDKKTFFIFNDSQSVNNLSGSYSFVETEISLTGSISRTYSEIGSRFKSSTCGLIFGESNTLGTDSIAFGGLKK